MIMLAAVVAISGGLTEVSLYAPKDGAVFFAFKQAFEEGAFEGLSLDVDMVDSVEGAQYALIPVFDGIDATGFQVVATALQWDWKLVARPEPRVATATEDGEEGEVLVPTLGVLAHFAAEWEWMLASGLAAKIGSDGLQVRGFTSTASLRQSIEELDLVALPAPLLALIGDEPLFEAQIETDIPVDYAWVRLDPSLARSTTEYHVLRGLIRASKTLAQVDAGRKSAWVQDAFGVNRREASQLVEPLIGASRVPKLWRPMGRVIDAQTDHYPHAFALRMVPDQSAMETLTRIPLESESDDQ